MFKQVIKSPVVVALLKQKVLKQRDTYSSVVDEVVEEESMQLLVLGHLDKQLLQVSHRPADKSSAVQIKHLSSFCPQS